MGVAALALAALAGPVALADTPGAPSPPTVSGPCGAGGGCATQDRSAEFQLHAGAPATSFKCELSTQPGNWKACFGTLDYADAEASPATDVASDATDRAIAWEQSGDGPAPGAAGTAAWAAANAAAADAAPVSTAAGADAQSYQRWAGAADPTKDVPDPQDLATDAAVMALVGAISDEAAAVQGWATPNVDPGGLTTPGAVADAAAPYETWAGYPQQDDPSGQWTTDATSGAGAAAGWAGGVQAPKTDPAAAVAAALVQEATSGSTPSKPDEELAAAEDYYTGWKDETTPAPDAWATDSATAAADVEDWQGRWGTPQSSPDAAAAAVAAALVADGGSPLPQGDPPTDGVDAITTAAGELPGAAQADAGTVTTEATDAVASVPPATLPPTALDAAGKAEGTAADGAAAAGPAAQDDATALTPATPPAGGPDLASSATYSLHNLPDGKYTLTVVAMRTDVESGTAADSATESQPTTYTWFVDRTPPAAPRLAAKPDAVGSATDAHFAFAGGPDIPGEPAGTFACTLDGGAEFDCSPSLDLHGVGLGKHTLSVHETDAAGNPGPATTYAWTVQPAPAPSGQQQPGGQQQQPDTGSSRPPASAGVGLDVGGAVTIDGSRQLASGQTIPPGAAVDARRGYVVLSVPLGAGRTQAVRVSGGPFRYGLQPDGRRLLLVLTLLRPGTLSVGAFACHCEVHTRDARVRGDGAVVWSTAERSRGTAVRVAQGRVSVLDRARCASHRPVALLAARRSTFVPRPRGRNAHGC